MADLRLKQICSIKIIAGVVAFGVLAPAFVVALACGGVDYGCAGCCSGAGCCGGTGWVGMATPVVLTVGVLYCENKDRKEWLRWQWS